MWRLHSFCSLRKLFFLYSIPLFGLNGISKIQIQNVYKELLHSFCALYAKCEFTLIRTLDFTESCIGHCYIVTYILSYRKTHWNERLLMCGELVFAMNVVRKPEHLSHWIRCNIRQIQWSNSTVWFSNEFTCRFLEIIQKNCQRRRRCRMNE